MIYYEIHSGPIVHAFRNALKNDARIVDYTDHVDLVEQLGHYNNCRVVGTEFIVTDHSTNQVKRTWTTDGIEFPDEKAYMWFMLKWAR